MLPGIEIRNMRASDLDAVHALILSSLDEPFTREVPLFFLNQWSGGSFVAADFSGKIVGYLGGSKLGGSRASVSLLCVAADYRCNGIGSALLDRLITAARIEGIRTVQLETRANRLATIRFYQGRGFMVVRELKDFYNDGGDAVRMVTSSSGRNC